MPDDLRLKHEADSKREAARLFEMGYGYGPVASMLSLPLEAVRKWLYTFRAVGKLVAPEDRSKMCPNENYAKRYPPPTPTRTR